MEPKKSIFKRNKFLKIIGNKYILVSVFFIVWMVALDNNSSLEHRVLNQKINVLEDNIDYYKKEISTDSVKIKHLKNNDQIEKYAREKYFMKKDNEDVYLIEFEDSITNKTK